jgi:hypothetical protein
MAGTKKSSVSSFGKNPCTPRWFRLDAQPHEALSGRLGWRAAITDARSHENRGGLRSSIESSLPSVSTANARKRNSDS